MTIDRLDVNYHVGKVNNVKRQHIRSESVSGDSISISEDAKNAISLKRFLDEVVANTPDVRLDKVEELKKKFNDPNYITDEVLAVTAERIMEQFGI